MTRIETSFCLFDIEKERLERIKEDFCLKQDFEVKDGTGWVRVRNFRTVWEDKEKEDGFIDTKATIFCDIKIMTYRAGWAITQIVLDRVPKGSMEQFKKICSSITQKIGVKNETEN